MRKVHCIYCGKPIYEGETAIRHRHFTGFYCTSMCLLSHLGVVEIATVTNKLVEDDKEASGFGWDEDEN